MISLLMIISVLVILSEAAETGTYSVKPIKIELSERAPRMIDMVKRTRLPAAELQSARDSLNISISTGVSLSTMNSLQKEWVTSFNWEKEQEFINQYHQFIAEVEDLKIHFIHELSQDPEAIPIILLHGWPSTMIEMIPLIDLLTSKGPAATGSQNTSFHVIIPSLPGFVLSDPAPDNWTTYDTARIFNTLMTDVLGYETYAVYGTDWGCAIGYGLYEKYSKTVRAAHMSFIPFSPLDLEQLAALNITLSAEEMFEEQRYLDFKSGDNGYFLQQATKPNTIGLALYDNPMGQLAWIAEKFILGSDTRRGSGPSVLTNNEILREVSLYYLTESFVSSVYMYHQNPNNFTTRYTKAQTDAPLLFSSFKYNVYFWPEALVEKIGNLVYYKFREFGGHFSALDNAQGLAEDIRMIGNYWGNV